MAGGKDQEQTGPSVDASQRRSGLEGTQTKPIFRQMMGLAYNRPARAGVAYSDAGPTRLMESGLKGTGLIG